MTGLCGFVIYLILTFHDGEFHVYFLDIGQGDSVLFVTPDGSEVLIDGGPGNKVIEELGEVLPFYDKTIEMLVLTHPDKDHMEGLVEVLKRYKVAKVMITGVLKQDALYEEFLREIDDIDVIIVDENSDFIYSEVSFDVLYPFEQIAGEEFENVNDTSIALMVEYEGKRVLLTGDAEEAEENELIAADLDLRADIFKAGHHGSKSSSSFEFLEKVRPKITVISAGKNNQYGHPHAETLENLEKIGVINMYRTDLEGRIEFEF
ncbi:MBL fold metallo-hydrolase [Candidatus Peregrinibacteria bacterium]|nr:MBL fold metallo-hydrolase [Candidatus Peregrinibacteria bacterium]